MHVAYTQYPAETGSSRATIAVSRFTGGSRLQRTRTASTRRSASSAAYAAVADDPGSGVWLSGNYREASPTRRASLATDVANWAIVALLAAGIAWLVHRREPGAPRFLPRL